VGAFQVLLMGRAADAAYAPLAALEPFMPFRDASCGVPCFNLQVQVRVCPEQLPSSCHVHEASDA
jgi:hypothetical protein